MLQPRSIITVTIGLLLVAAFPAVAQSNSLDSLPLATQDEISQVCLPVQFREGATAYRNCIQTEIDLRTSGGVTELGQLSFDDKYAVQQACAKAGGQSSESYRNCVSVQVSELSQVPAPTLSELSEDELYVVQQTCFNAQSSEGAASYRQCLNQETQSLLDVPAVDTSNLNMLNKNALQLRCSSNSTNVVQYRRCVAVEFESIAGTAPTFLPEGETNAADVAVSPADNLNINDSASDVNSNVLEQNVEQNGESAPIEVQALEAEIPEAEIPEAEIPEAEIPEAEIPEAEVPEVEVPEEATEIAVLNSETATAEPATSMPRYVNQPADTLTTDSTTTPGEPTTALSQEEQALASTAETPVNDVSDNPSSVNSLPETTNNINITNTQEGLPSTESRVISRPDLVQTLEVQSQEGAQSTQQLNSDSGNESDASAPPSALPPNAQPLEKLKALWQQLLDKLSTMDAIGWLLIAAVLALPALLLGLFSMARGLKKSTPLEPEYATVHNNRFEPEHDSQRLRHEHDAATLFDDEVDSDHDAVTRIASKSEQQRVSQRQHNTDTMQSAYGFGDWLLKQPEASRMEACIEFLIYWVAYGDDRYQPDLKQRLFTATDLTTHDQIKRWVLKQDVVAFADVIGWLRTNATQKQLDQCVALLMALLVTEHSITPVQNTVIRFLSDAFNIGKNQIEQRFEKAFGHPMPPVPRTDKHAWWVKQKPEFMQRWEARFMATRTEHEQMIARLGLNADFDDAQVINAFRRAARRCHPDRFTELGDRERALAEQQFEKFEQARDKLLGVSV